MAAKRVLIQIGQLSEVTGISISALNHYLNKGLIHPVDRATSGYRLFDPEECEARLERISQLKKSGKTLDEIKDSLNGGR